MVRNGHDPARPHAAAEPAWDRPARLAVGVVSAGRVGAALGAALERAGHIVAAAVAPSPAAHRRLAALLPETTAATVAETVTRAELLILAVPDTALAEVAAEAAAAAVDHTGRIVLHTAGAHGTAVLAPLADRGAICLAVHPAMTFTDEPGDVDRLAGACFGVTADDAIGAAIGSALVLEIGGEPVPVAEADRTLYHAAMAHGANHLVTLVNDAVDALSIALDRAPGRSPDAPAMAARMLAPLAGAALDNALRRGDGALTGPIARGDAATVTAHVAALAAADADLAAAYRAAADRTARRVGAAAVTEALEAHR